MTVNRDRPVFRSMIAVVSLVIVNCGWLGLVEGVPEAVDEGVEDTEELGELETLADGVLEGVPDADVEGVADTDDDGE